MMSAPSSAAPVSDDAALDPELLRQIVDLSDEAILVLDLNGRILTANPATTDLLGHERADIVGKNISVLVDAPGLWSLGDAAPICIEVESRHRDGRRVPTSLRLSRFGRKWGDVRIAVLRDLSALRQARSDIAKLSLALEHCSSMVVLARLDGIIEWVNGRFCEITGYRQEDVIGRHSRLLSSGHTPPEDYRHLWKDITAGRSWTGEFHNRYRDGSLHWVAATISPIRDESGEIAGFFAIEDDITESRATREALRLSQQRLAVAIQAIDDGFAIYNPDETLAMCNDRYRSMMMGWADQTPVGRSFESLLRESLRHGTYHDVGADPEDWVARRLAAFRSANVTLEQPLSGGQWIQVSERITSDGGRVALRTDVTLLKQVQDQLRRAKEEADAANRAKSDFLSKMTHELRTPLNGILGFGEMLKINPAEPPTPLQARCIDHILEAGRHLLELINDILDLARIEAGRLTIDPAPVDVADLVTDCVELLQPQADAATVALAVADGPATTLWADPRRLKQVVINLLSNAIKYNRPDGKVVVSFGADAGGMGWLEVADTGIGMTEEQLGRLFTPFDRLGIEAVHSDGTGIGLSITRQLVEAMGGSITPRSKPDVGTTFRVEIPTAPQPQK